MIDLLNSDARRIPLADQSVQCIITSPPYWGLRDYGTATWQGGEPACDHVMENRPQRGHNGRDFGDIRGDELSKTTTRIQYRDTCAKCGAIRIDAQIGLERVPDCLGWATGRPCGECYVCHIVAVMRECWRVLRDDGVLWLNLGDSYARQAGDDSTKETDSGMKTGRTGKSAILFKSGNNKPPAGLKPKDLCMIPARVALALQADGWYLRSEIVWSKPNPMPESVTDRPTKAHEMIYLLTKKPQYYYDAIAIQEESAYDGRKDTMMKGSIKYNKSIVPGQSSQSFSARGHERWPNKNEDGTRARNRRSVWTVATQPYSGAHFATFPPALVEPMILAGTSARGACPTCGMAWMRVLDKTQYTPEVVDPGMRFVDDSRGDKTRKLSGKEYNEQVSSVTIGWRPACACYDVPPLPEYSDEPDDENDVDNGNGDMPKDAGRNKQGLKTSARMGHGAGWRKRDLASTSERSAEHEAIRAERARLLDLYAALPVVPCIVLDPFAGSGTVGKVAVKHGRRFVGCELNREYIDLAFERTSKVQIVMQL